MSSPVALVTGASRGIGARTALALAEDGFDVVCAARSTRESPGRIEGTIDDVAAQVERLGRRALALPLDVRDESALVAAVDRVYGELGRCDLLVNNAGVIAGGDALTLPLRHWQLVMDVNVTGPYLLIRELVPRMGAGDGGRIINISSGAVAFPRYPFVSYTASKAALEALTEGLGLQTPPTVSINALRVDAVVWSEGLVAAQGEEAAAAAEDPDRVADAVVWVAHRPLSTTGRVFSYSDVVAEARRR